jgi:catechol 2,3-dioxygenase-like lactoylglutathione lyase family enzyme
MLRIGNAYMEIFQYATPTPAPVNPARPVCDQGWTHLCLDVTDVDAEYQRMLAAGVDTHSEPQRVADGVKTLYVRDPDGNVLEMQEVFPNTQSDALIGIPSFTPKA